MNRINFLEQKTHFWQRLEFNYFWVLIFILFLGLSLTTTLVANHFRFKKIETHFQQITEENLALQKIIDAKMAKRVVKTLPSDMVKDPVIWHVLLEKISKRMPPLAQLLRLNASLSELRELSIHGLAPSLDILLQIEKNMQDLPRCQRMQLKHLSESQQNENAGEFSFTLKCSLS